MATRAAPDLRELLATVQGTLTRLEDQATRTDARADETVRLTAKLGAQVEQLSNKVDQLAATQNEDREQSMGDRREIKQLVTSTQSLNDRKFASLEAQAKESAHTAAIETADRTVAGVAQANKPMRRVIIWGGGGIGTVALTWVWTNWDLIWHRLQIAAKFVVGFPDQ